MKTLVLGLGNVLLQDEGAGVRVVQHLQEQYVFPQDVAVIEGGTLGLNLLPDLEGAARVLIVDAVKADEPPGTLLRLCNDEIPTFLGPKVSPHDIGLQDLLALAQLRGHLPSEIVLWGIQAATIAPGLALSEAVAAQVENTAERVIEQLATWDVRVDKKCAV